MVAVLGISSSSRAQLVAQIDALGTNLLTVTPGQSFDGQTVPCPGRARHGGPIGPVIGASAIGDVNANVYRNDRISPANTNAIAVYSANTGLLRTLQGRLARGTFLNPATARYPAAVLGADAAGALGIDRADGTAQVWLGPHWFSVVGILRPVPLAPELDRAALIGLPVAERCCTPARPGRDLRAGRPGQRRRGGGRAPGDCRPGGAAGRSVTNPADALTARADAARPSGPVPRAGRGCALVGGIGIANVMVIAVLERRGEIGLRRALGARRGRIAPSSSGRRRCWRAAGVSPGRCSAASHHRLRGGQALERRGPGAGPLGAAVAALLVGAAAGLYPALRAARLVPAKALRLS